MDGEGGEKPAVTLPRMTPGKEMVKDYLALRLSLRGHQMELLRPAMPDLVPHADLATERVVAGARVFAR